MKIDLRLLYLYLFSFIGLIITVIGTIQIVDLGLKVYIFKDADVYTYQLDEKTVDQNGNIVEISEEEKDKRTKLMEEENKKNRQRQISTALSMMLVGLPLYKYHWSLIKKESKVK